MKPRELMKIAEQQGFQPRKRGATAHVIWVKRGSRSVPIPNHGDIRNVLASQIMKQLGAK